MPGEFSGKFFYCGDLAFEIYRAGIVETVCFEKKSQQTEKVKLVGGKLWLKRKQPLSVRTVAMILSSGWAAARAAVPGIRW